MKYLKYYLLALSVILIDQIVKLTIHHYMIEGEEIVVLGDWLKLHYTTNPGMAFGLEFGSEYGKLGLTFFRLLAMTAIGYFLYRAAKKEVYHPGFLWCVALILGGAIGNVIDSTFYGYFLDNAPFTENPPPFYPWFHGKVIDMFYVDLWEGEVPESVPLIGGNRYSLWPIFNVADASIFIGVALILVLQRKFFPSHHHESKTAVHSVTEESVDIANTNNPEEQNPSLEISDNPVTS
jgi:signal peptidase II